MRCSTITFFTSLCLTIKAVRNQLCNIFEFNSHIAYFCCSLIYDVMYKAIKKTKIIKKSIINRTFLSFILELLINDYFGLQLYGTWLAFVV